MQMNIISDEGLSHTDSHANTQDVKVLGVTWQPSSDSLVFDPSHILAEANNLQPSTKRNLVSLIGRFYDPLGFLAPVTIRYKVLFQSLCQSRLD